MKMMNVFPFAFSAGALFMYTNQSRLQQQLFYWWVYLICFLFLGIHCIFQLSFCLPQRQRKIYFANWGIYYANKLKCGFLFFSFFCLSVCINSWIWAERNDEHSPSHAVVWMRWTGLWKTRMVWTNDVLFFSSSNQYW